MLFDALEFFLEFRSFRLSRVSSEVWLDVGSMFKLGLDVKAASYFGVAPSFKEARFSSREQRESREQQLGVSFRPEISVPPTRCSSNEIGLEGRSSAYTAHFPCSKFICLVILSHEENILADFYMCYNHTLWAEGNFHSHQIIATEMSFH